MTRNEMVQRLYIESILTQERNMSVDRHASLNAAEVTADYFFENYKGEHQIEISINGKPFRISDKDLRDAFKGMPIEIGANVHMDVNPGAPKVTVKPKKKREVYSVSPNDLKDMITVMTGYYIPGREYQRELTASLLKAVMAGKGVRMK